MNKDIRVLISDDEMSIRGVVTSVLSEDGYQVTSAENGEEALRLFTPIPYHIVISDIVMGGMTGIDLLKKVKEINKDTEVIIMTSHASLDTAVEALRAGAYDYLIKPFDDIKIISMVTARAADRFNLVMENKKLIKSLTQRNEELEIINKELNGLMGHMSHPPASATAAPHAAGTIDTGTILRNIEAIKQETLRSKTMIENLMHGRKPVVEATDAGDVIRRICAVIKHRFTLNAITLQEVLAPNLPAVLCTANQLERIIMHMMAHVQQRLKGTRGAARISARAMPPNHLEIRVTDTGPGIPAPEQPEFFQTLAAKHAGNVQPHALLASLSIVREYHGSMRVESQPGQGTSFIALLPLAVRTAQAGTQAGAPAGKEQT
jgi:YesN/AraC family two-component response regulator